MPDKRRLKEGEMFCRVTDEPVVVVKYPPEKPGNGVEDKTDTTCGLVRRGWRRSQKRRWLRRGEVHLKVPQIRWNRLAENKPPDGAGK